MPDTETIVADVVVVGFGGAGAVAAIAAASAGAEVVVLEKRAHGGGATRLASGGIMVPTDASFANYLDDIWLGHTPREVVERFVAGAMEIPDYCASIGVQLTGWAGNSQEVSISYPPVGRVSWPLIRDGKMTRMHAITGDETPVPPDVWKQMSNNERVRRIGRAYGVDLWRQLEAAVTERGIPVITGVRAQQLLRDADGAVTGVLAERDGADVVYEARRGVVLTTGGFASNEEMKRTYLSAPFVYAGTNDFATGDGHAMAQRIGSRQWHMQTVCGQVGFKAPEFDQAFQPRAVSEAFVWVDRQGHRYTNETAEKIHNAWRSAALFDPERDLRDGREWPRVPVYMVFDETMRLRAPISRDWRVEGDHEWSLDNSDELDRGWIISGDSVVELATKLDMDPDQLAATIRSFNDAARTGDDDADFGRIGGTMAPIENGPFYALPLVPMLISTQGGPEHDAESRVLDVDGEPIPRLYAAGELSSVVGWLYEAGSGHAECIVFGRIAGDNAAREIDRSV